MGTLARNGLKPVRLSLTLALRKCDSNPNKKDLSLVQLA